MFYDYEIKNGGQNGGHLLLKHITGKWTVVYFDPGHNQVQSVMPGDMPDDGGIWFAPANDAGIKYVSNLYSESYARKKYREAVSLEQQFCE